jgi:hypothetical protein
MTEVAREVRLSIEGSQAAAKRRYDRGIAPIDIGPGDIVKMLEKTRRSGRKLRDRFTGPYRVLRTADNADGALVIEMRPGVERTVNVALLQPYYGRRAR